MKRMIWTCCCWWLLQTVVIAQSLRPPSELSQLLQTARVELLEPLESDYHVLRPSERSTDYQPYDYAIYSRKEKLEIRYLVQPIADGTTALQLPPHAQFMRTLTHVASNDESTVIAVHRMATTDLDTVFLADWGKEALFSPKSAFSGRTYCKMLMLHKSEQANVFVFFLFDDPNTDWEKRYYALQFLPD